MKKKEMIKEILKQEQKLWNDLQRCIEILGSHDPVTASATTRWATINELAKKLGL